MSEEAEDEMTTKEKIDTLINNIQNRLNKRVRYNNPNKGNVDLNIFQSFGGAGINIDPENINSKYNKGFQSNAYLQNPRINNYINDINQPYISNSLNSPLNEIHIRSIIKEEFNNLIIPYQKDVICNSNLMETKLNEIEKKFQIIINAQEMGNLNDNAKIISAYLCSNLSNDNLNKNVEKLKIEYDALFDGLQKKIDSISSQLNMQKMGYDSNFSNLFKKMDIFEKKMNENENKEIKEYVEKNIFDDKINNIYEKQNKAINDSENNLRNLYGQIETKLLNLKNQIDTINNSLNQYKLDINSDSNKINSINNNLNSFRTDFGKLTEDLSQIKYLVTPELVNKINSIDFNSLKQQVSQNEFKNLKDNINIFETNLNSIKTMAENSDRSIFDLKKLINNVEEKQNSSNKKIENIQPLLNENILEKIKTMNNKIEELSKANEAKIVENNNKEKKDNIDKENNNNEEEKKESEPELFSGGSRRQQRNKTVINNLNKSTNSNLDEKSLKLIKQLEKINLNDLEKIDFNNILNQINDINNENKLLSNKINEQNKEISEINEKIKNLQNNNNLNNNLNNNINNNNLFSNQNTYDRNKYNFSKSEIKEDFKTSMFEFNDPYKRDPKTEKKEDNILKDKDKNKDKDNIFNSKKEDEIIEDDYDDFDKDFDQDIDGNKNDLNIDNKKEKEKNTFELFDNKNKKDNLIGSNNNFGGSDPFNKKGSKNELGGFDKYAETNILDQIIGLGGSRRNNDFEKNSGGTFITGSLKGSKNNNILHNDNLPFMDEGNKNKSKNDEIKEKKENDDDEFNDNFDDFDIDDI